MKTILVTGSDGQLGNEINSLKHNFKNFNFIFTDKGDLDITNPKELSIFFEDNKIDYCINAAAYTAVDKAEEDMEMAFMLNSEAVLYLVDACAINNTKLIQISTDFVFDGKANKSLKEDDTANPLSVYGFSKLKGEEIALQNNALVIRTSWLYSTFGNNFVKTMIKLGSERDELNIIDDQIGTPTYAKDLAEMILFLIENFDKDKLSGLYHFSNDGKASWYDFAVEIFRIKGIECKVNPIPTTEYPTPAERPKYSVMDKSKIKYIFSIALKDWKLSLRRCLNEIEL